MYFMTRMLSRAHSRIIFFVCIAFFYSAPAYAYVPVLVTQESLSTISTIEDPTLLQGFYGELTGFPHTFEIRAENAFLLRVEVNAPDLPKNTNTLSGIIIKEQKRGRVEEVTRMEGKSASWEVVEDGLSGANYRTGTTFEKELDSGVYRIEVHTPDNLEKYMLMVGTRDEMEIGYFELLRRLVDVEHFFERSAFWIIESAYVYIPLLMLLCCLGIGVYVWRMRRLKGDTL